IEEQLKDAPRAFRAHLVALLLAPDDADTTSHLWRLARVIGKYRETDKTPHPEPAPATIQLDSAVGDITARTKPPTMPPPSGRVPRRASTEPLMEDDIDLSVGDSTQPIDINEIELATRSAALPKKDFQTE